MYLAQIEYICGMSDHKRFTILLHSVFKSVYMERLMGAHKQFYSKYTALQHTVANCILHAVHNS